MRQATIGSPDSLPCSSLFALRTSRQPARWNSYRCGVPNSVSSVRTSVSPAAGGGGHRCYVKRAALLGTQICAMWARVAKHGVLV